MDIKLLAFFLTILFVTGVGFALGYILRSWQMNRMENSLEERISRQRAEAQDEITKQKKSAQDEVDAIRKKSEQRQQKIEDKEQSLDERQKRSDKREEALRKLEHTQREQQEKTTRLHQQAEQELTRIAGISKQEALQTVTKQMEQEHEQQLMRTVSNLELVRQEEIDKKAQGILATAIQRFGNAVDNDMLSTHVHLPDEESKGKIIGKEGRNIKSFEQVTGVQLIVDDTPGQISISSFDPIRRAVAKTALDKLMSDGRIQPSRIESMVEEAKNEIDATIIEKGKQAALECGVNGLPQELLHILGRLYFRYSYGQNVLQHSIEMAHIAKVLAVEIGADDYVARAGALLHDIGKAVDHEVDGTHVEIGRRMLQKYGIDESIVKAMQAHHEEYPYETLESRIVQTADAISSARPGARSDNAEMFLQKVEGLERIARAVEGVSDAYAVSAGREVRIFVNPTEVNDYQAAKIAARVAKQVEQELKYPGEIKVVVIREKRSIEIAR